jgi:8-oxo-dGTP pyrophosphatase MutT (NUDIX family)
MAVLSTLDVPVTSWLSGKTKTVDDLAAEILAGESFLRIDARGVRRVVAVAVADFRDSRSQQLLEVEQVFPNGRRRERNELPGGRIKSGKTPEEAICAEIEQELHLPASTYKLAAEPVFQEQEREGGSSSFPGLWSVYQKYIFRARLLIDLPDPYIVTETEEGIQQVFSWRPVPQ